MRDISRRSACLVGGGSLLVSPFAATAGLPLALPTATFGVQIYDDETARVLTLRALEAGFRSFFASTESGNQRGFAAAIRESGVPRDSLFITGSVLSDAGDSGAEAYSLTERGCRENARNLLEGGGIEQPFDMLLLEFPARSRAAIRGQWRAMERARTAGLTRQIGCANFALADLDAVLTDGATRTRPAVNQRCYSLAYPFPYPALRAAHAARGVPLQAWSPLGGTSGLPAEVRAAAAAIGRRDGRGASAQQVALRWCSQRGVSFALHSSSVDHLRQDLGSAALQLRPEELAELDALVDGPLLPDLPI